MSDLYKDLWKAKRQKGGLRYQYGVMHCRVCSIWVKQGYGVGKGENRCPCCNSIMGASRRNGYARVIRLKGLPDQRYVKAIS